MSDNIPDCFCNEEGMQSCDWVIEASVKYYRRDHASDPTSLVDWNLDNIPQPLAQIIQQAMVAAVNEQGFNIYTEWMKSCHGGESEMAERMVRVFENAKIG